MYIINKLLLDLLLEVLKIIQYEVNQSTNE